MNNKIFIFIFFLFFLFSCSSIESNNIENTKQSISNLSKDIQKYLFMPPDTEVLMNESVVIGKNDNLVGKITFVTKSDIETVYSFIRDNYSKDKWELKTSYQSENSLLIFEKNNKLISIDIAQFGLMKNKVKIKFTLSGI